jgi:hypothetical protein
MCSHSGASNYQLFNNTPFQVLALPLQKQGSWSSSFFHNNSLYLQLMEFKQNIIVCLSDKYFSLSLWMLNLLVSRTTQQQEQELLLISILVVKIY